ncbi:MULTISPECIES: DUF402 domain-containing protein [Frankia]|uniref:DUF402 domain-containing protein n=1 Tax=Frankia TaxID=1854 RepID=UPI0018E38848|nr:MULTISPECIES: DUF402 domain-containing protein [Frankia]
MTKPESPVAYDPGSQAGPHPGPQASPPPASGAAPAGPFVPGGFVPGEVVVHRSFTTKRLVFVRAGHVVGHDERGLRLWIPHGCPMAVELSTDGRGLRDMPFAEWIRQSTVLVTRPWPGPNILMLIPPAGAHSVWWFWDRQGRFARWYINLEAPAVAWRYDGLVGVDTTDHDLDLWVCPDRTWQWKDEHELAERLAFPEHYWVTDAAAVRAEGERLLRLVEARAFPFDGTWCDFQPDPSWRTPDTLPPGWDRPRAPGTTETGPR